MFHCKNSQPPPPAKDERYITINDLNARTSSSTCVASSYFYFIYFPTTLDDDGILSDSGVGAHIARKRRRRVGLYIYTDEVLLVSRA